MNNSNASKIVTLEIVEANKRHHVAFDVPARLMVDGDALGAAKAAAVAMFPGCIACYCNVGNWSDAAPIVL